MDNDQADECPICLEVSRTIPLTGAMVRIVADITMCRQTIEEFLTYQVSIKMDDEGDDECPICLEAFRSPTRSDLECIFRSSATVRPCTSSTSYCCVFHEIIRA
ncbi:unnamed protein product [Cylicocyclus nassatus]|uniref:Zinc finger protein n=1 Tax=Cylicocyclus nassatus TaxID=53992 RepID=A0AA36MEH5_CYLNA|nr:unnamed protein product [Cylicocyclus nassatus]